MSSGHDDPAIAALLADLVLANHILAYHGIVDSFGHISVRHPHDPSRYFLAVSRAPEQVSLEDMIEFDLDSVPTTAESRPLYGERAIHGRIYAARPDVQSVCHNHAPATIPFGVTGVPLRAIWHQAAPIGYEIPIWDIREQFGATSLLVRERATGDALAAALGPNRVVLMRGHGCSVVGTTIREAVYTAYYLQQNATLLTASLGMSRDVNYLEREEVELATRVQFSPVAQNRSWDAWASQAQRVARTQG